MTDYLQELQFGVFVPPLAGQADAVVELAELAEVAGLDLVTFQDHPYQPRFLDTWTLLSVIAAKTSTVRLAPNVANLPLRPPAVLARSAASLDILANGRVELGLGAGAFWDAIEAMGGRRLTPGESVTALSEAIDVIRAIWTGPTVRVDGEFHRVHGAKPGPPPAHEIELWLGAYKPRMLRLTGEKGDGWLPSQSYLDMDKLGELSARIDDAAAKADREPGEDPAAAQHRPGHGARAPRRAHAGARLQRVHPRGPDAPTTCAPSPRTSRRACASSSRRAAPASAPLPPRRPARRRPALLRHADPRRAPRDHLGRGHPPDRPARPTPSAATRPSSRPPAST